ncbi:MAG: low molecular weight phosphotyrosine protein phosphatase [Candidatus Abyssobacteria bacterium SURF_17]|uniref:protein-tyrosine-phosphatase n=1 Tax=Candidatus Abyssobacteria bacterium SURF_17 TaxID=2093361 RepID=A0A419EN11_9BACT|nr:MAG: low molecular weight phosphotyrosine protein phosphatase [Candidatus Abyssubacteria bacterium SURF_17]
MGRHVLFVCTGNLCRSPLAEGILRKLLADRGINSIKVSSAGTFALTGWPAAELALEVAFHHKVDISSHRSRPISRELLDAADLVIGMERDHIIESNVVVKDGCGKYCLLSDFGPAHSRGREIEDPYGAPFDYFVSAYREIERHVEALLDHLVEHWGLNMPTDR